MRTDETAPTGDQDLHGSNVPSNPPSRDRNSDTCPNRKSVGLDIRLRGLDIRSRLCSGLFWTRLAAPIQRGDAPTPATLHAARDPLRSCSRRACSPPSSARFSLPPRRRPRRPGRRRRGSPASTATATGFATAVTATSTATACATSWTRTSTATDAGTTTTTTSTATASRTRSTRTVTPPASSSERARRRPRRLPASSGSSRTTRSGVPTPTRPARARWPRSPAPALACCASRSTGP